MQMTPMQRRFIRLSASFVVRDFDYWTLPSLVKGFVMEQTFRLDLNQSWEAIDIKTGHAVLIPKGSHQAIRMLLKSPPDQTEENYLVVAVQDEGGPVLAGLREAHWRHAAERFDIAPRKVSPLIVSISLSKPPDNLDLWRLSW